MSTSSIIFTSDVSQNPYLPEGETLVNAIMSVTSKGSGGAAVGSGQGLALGFIVDKSGSMRGEKIVNARAAVCQGIDLLRPEHYFFVIAGSDSGEVVVSLMQATPQNKERAKIAVKGIKDDGGTYMSRWLGAAAKEFAKAPNAIHQAILLTDGENEGSDETPLETQLVACEGKFQCECRGVQADFQPEQLRKIAGKLLGTVDFIRDASGIAADFAAIIEKSKGLAVRDVMAQIWVPAGAEIVSFKQMTPDQLDLTGKKQKGPNAQTSRFPTGAWGAEDQHDYHIVIKLGKTSPAGGPEMLAGRAALIFIENGVETKVGEAKIVARWTDDVELSSKINPTVANYTGQAELAAQVQAGLAARKAGNEAEATKALGRAMELAEQTGNDGTKKLLAKVVEKDPKDGTIKLKRNVSDADAVELDTRSTRTKRVAKTAPADGSADKS